jgi:hypothetical protein
VTPMRLENHDASSLPRHCLVTAIPDSCRSWSRIGYDIQGSGLYATIGRISPLTSRAVSGVPQVEWEDRTGTVTVEALPMMQLLRGRLLADANSAMAALTVSGDALAQAPGYWADAKPVSPKPRVYRYSPIKRSEYVLTETAWSLRVQ